jgi:hypothetical protein
MKIIEIEILNNKAIKVFKTKLDGNNLEIAGDTGTGKTTAISAFWEILEKQSECLKKNEKSGKIKIKIGADGNGKWYIAERKITPSTSTINIINEKGDKISINDFKNMISNLSINPQKIFELKPKEQIKALLSAANIINFDPEKADGEIKSLEENRIKLFREVESLKPGAEPEKVDYISLSELIYEKELADKNNKKAEDIKEKFEKLKGEYDKKIVEKNELEKKIAEMKIITERLRDDIESGIEYINALEIIPVDPIKDKIKNSEIINKKASIYEGWKKQQEKFEKAVSVHKEIDEKVKEKVAKRKEILEGATYPIDGIKIKDGLIYFNDFLIDNLGESEKMLVAAGIAIEGIKKHPFKIVRIDGIESMSKKDFGELKKLFNGHDIQVLSTRVSRGEIEPNEIVIIDGEYCGHDSGFGEIVS